MDSAVIHVLSFSGFSLCETCGSLEDLRVKSLIMTAIIAVHLSLSGK